MQHQIKLLKSKIHGIAVTEANLAYRGSLTLDEDLMDQAEMMEYEKVLVVNNHNGERLETYLIKGQRGSGVCCLNGAAAHKGSKGHELIVMTFMIINQSEAKDWKPIRVFVNGQNRVSGIQRD